MTLRIVNDDPRCKHPNDCKVGGNIRAAVACWPCRHAARAQRIADNAARMRPVWKAPIEFQDLYVTIKAKVGASEARRIVGDEVARAERKQARRA